MFKDDARLDRLADVVVGYSTDVQPGEKVLIDVTDTPPEMVVALIRRVRAAGGVPFAETSQATVRRELFMHATDVQMETLCRRDLGFMEEMQAYVASGVHTTSRNCPTSRTRRCASRRRR